MLMPKTLEWVQIPTGPEPHPAVLVNNSVMNSVATQTKLMTVQDRAKADARDRLIEAGVEAPDQSQISRAATLSHPAILGLLAELGAIVNWRGVATEERPVIIVNGEPEGIANYPEWTAIGQGDNWGWIHNGNVEGIALVDGEGTIQIPEPWSSDAWMTAADLIAGFADRAYLAIIRRGQEVPKNQMLAQLGSLFGSLRGN